VLAEAADPGDDDLEEPGDGESPSEEGGRRRFGRYELLGMIDRGGMGVVYRARFERVRRVVALKMIASGALADAMEVHRFHAEAEAAAHLDHPRIVPIYEIGEVDGCHYFTMKLMAGNLSRAIKKLRGEPRAAAEIVMEIAEAIHHGHQRGIIHRDLKPANILLDEEGLPYVADFGVAKRVERDGGLTRSGVVVGTPSYMAPEQASGGSRYLTVAVDIYSLGAILYELLTGRPPFVGETAVDILRQVTETEPRRPRALDGRIHQDLETICLKCLEKDPARRYGSAELLAKDLRRFLDGEPIEARHVGRAARIWRWCRRHPLVMGGLALVLSLSLIVASAAVALADAQRDARRKQVIDTNMVAAEMVARTTLRELATYVEYVMEIAESSELRRHVELDDREELLKDARSAFELQIGARKETREPSYLAAFSSFFIADLRGVSLARWPSPEADDDGKSVAERDYFRGALERARERTRDRRAYISQAFWSDIDQSYQIAIAAPVYSTTGEPAGVLVATIPTGASVGAVALGKERRTVALASQLDSGLLASQHRKAPRKEYVILMHDALSSGEVVEVRKGDSAISRFSTEPGLEQLEWPEGRAAAPDDYYIDPVAQSGVAGAAAYKGRWLAGFAPVGGTGLVAIVQTRDGDATGSEGGLLEQLEEWVQIAAADFALIALVTIAAAWRHGAARRIKPLEEPERVAHGDGGGSAQRTRTDPERSQPTSARPPGERVTSALPTSTEGSSSS
jgi:serine/threonine-protein kinase